MSDELKPCPFCGAAPELPSGEGTQYEIECGGCGQAVASVKICDLMIIEEGVSDPFTNYRYAVDRAKKEAIKKWNRRAQPPAQDEAVIELLKLARDRIESERLSGEYDPLLRGFDAAIAQRGEGWE